jgi:hypothetical protein
VLRVDAQEPMPVRSGAGAAAAGLNAEQVVEKGCNEVVVQVALAARPDPEGYDGKSLRVRMAKDLYVWVSLPPLQRPAP